MSAADRLLELSAQAQALGQRAAAKLEGLDETAAARLALEEVAAAGLTGWTVPAAFGGTGDIALCGAEEVSVRALCSLRSALAYHSGMLDVMFVMQGLGSYALARAGSAKLRDEWLPQIAQGQRVAAFALTEPEAGSDLGGLSTRAERSGDSWKLSGRKTFISNCGIADCYTLLARTSGEPGDGGKGSCTMFLVPGDVGGLRCERFEVTAPHPIGDLLLDGVEIPDDNRLGEVGAGVDLALSVLGRFRTSVAAAACGFGRRALDESIERLGQRRQFGRPLSSFQGLRFDLAEMDTRLRAAELLTNEAADLLDAGERAAAPVARAKLAATETASWVCDRAVQYFGGLGVKRGSVVERLWRDVRALRIYEGTSEVQRLILARELLDAGTQSS